MADVPANTPETKTLTRLVSGLSLDERHDFLEKLKGQTTLTFEPLYEADEKEVDTQAPLKEQYVKLPWFQRLCYFLQGLFTGKSPVAAFEDSQIGKLGRAIDAKAPGLYDHQRNLLLVGFYRYLTSLKEAARFFFTALDASVNRDKADFYAFLGSLEMVETHRALQSRTAPEAILENSPDISDTELRQMALRIMEDAFSSIDDRERTVMYFNARSLKCLKELSAFLFDRVLMAFSSKTGSQTCPASAVRELLLTLNNILASLKDSPNLSLLESLFVFQLQERAGEHNFDMSDEMHLLLSKAENAILLIRNFNRHIPLTLILRCITRDIRLTPQHISGGEDWFQVYREYWRKRVDAGVTEYLRQHKFREINNACKQLFKGADVIALAHAATEDTPGFPLGRAFSLSFLRTFHHEVFLPDINPLLRPIILEGVFTKKENRNYYTNAYNEIMNIEEDVKKIEVNLGPAGDYGKPYEQIWQDYSNLPAKRRKAQMVIDEASDEAEKIITRASEAISETVNMLGSILKRGSGSDKHDGLANFAKLAGRNPEAFIGGITGMILQFQRTIQILKDIESLESLI
ncbi:MAG: DUF5312 domain-containing protein [Treponema sp.]|jgi:truncated hemoglobin YjbI|nr:DUF5312 domain-containing protein [Treponema sp.]